MDPDGRENTSFDTSFAESDGDGDNGVEGRPTEQTVFINQQLSESSFDYTEISSE